MNAKDEGRKDSAAGPWRARWAALGVAAALAAGCGGGEAKVPVYPTTGQIKIGGKTPEGAFVALHPTKPIEVKPGTPEPPKPSAQVKSDGSFTLTTFSGGDGAPEGEYVVTVDWRPLVKEQNGDLTAGPNVVPGEFTMPNSSTIKVSVKPGENKLPPIDIKAANAPSAPAPLFVGEN